MSYEDNKVDRALNYLGMYSSFEEIKDNLAMYTISDIELFDKSEDFDIHYYIASGVVEKIVSRFFPRANCNVDDIDIKNRIVKLSLKLN